MSKEVTEGYFNARVSNYSITTTKDGSKPQAQIQFKWKDSDGDDHTKSWYGSFANDQAKEITAKTFTVCGFKGNSLEPIRQGAETKALDMENEVQIVIKPDTFNEKTTLKIKYVNPLIQRISKEQGVKLLSGLNMDGFFMKARQDLGVKKTELKNHAKDVDNEYGPEPTFDPSADIPF